VTRTCGLEDGRSLVVLEERYTSKNLIKENRVSSGSSISVTGYLHGEEHCSKYGCVERMKFTSWMYSGNHVPCSLRWRCQKEIFAHLFIQCIQLVDNAPAKVQRNKDSVQIC
jgi:hypothetical protein